MPAFIYQKDNFAKGIRFAVGQSDFETLIESNACLVDKTEVIQEIIDSTDTIILFPRPRRFGKTLLMRMLKTFFEKTEYSKRPLFEPLNIWQLIHNWGCYFILDEGPSPLISWGVTTSMSFW